MSKLIPGLLGLLALLPRPAYGDDARSVVERAMKARTDKPELLEKQRCQILVMEGKMAVGPDKEVDTTGELQAEWPNRLRWERKMSLIEGGGKLNTTMVFHGDRAWKVTSTTPASDLSLTDTDEFRVEIYGRWLALLYPLKDKAFTLTLLKDSRVGDEDVSVVRASLRFRPDVYLSFSKKTGHLLKVAYRASEGGADLRKEHIFSDYREFDGLKLPARLVDTIQFGTRPAMRVAEWKITDYKFVDKLGAEVFARPDEKKEE